MATKTAPPPVVPAFDDCPGYFFVTERDPGGSRIPKTRLLKVGNKIAAKDQQWITWKSRARLDDYSSMSVDHVRRAWGFAATVPALRGVDLRGLTLPASIEGAPLGRDFIELLRAMPELRSLTLAHAIVPGESLRALAEMPGIESLELLGDRHFPDGLGELSGSAALRELDLSFVALDNDGARALGSHPSLARLSIMSAKPSTDFDLGAFLDRLHALKQLSLSNMPLFHPGEPSHLGGFSALEYLALHEIPGLRDEHLAPIAKHPTLEHVSISMSTGLTDAALATIATIPKLKRLQAYGVPNLTDAGLQALAAAPLLASLSLASGKTAPHITKAGVAALRVATAGRLTVHGWK